MNFKWEFVFFFEIKIEIVRINEWIEKKDLNISTFLQNVL